MVEQDQAKQYSVAMEGINTEELGKTEECHTSEQSSVESGNTEKENTVECYQRSGEQQNTELHVEGGNREEQGEKAVANCEQKEQENTIEQHSEDLECADTTKKQGEEIVEEWCARTGEQEQEVPKSSEESDTLDEKQVENNYAQTTEVNPSTCEQNTNEKKAKEAPVVKSKYKLRARTHTNYSEVSLAKRLQGENTFFFLLIN